MNICKIILAEEDEDDRQIFKDAFEEVKKIDLIIVKNGMELMNILDNMPELPDTIFLNVRISGKDGYTCLKEIKSNDRLQNIPIIVYANSHNSWLIRKAFKEGANLYMAKPNSFCLMKQMINKIFTLHSAFFGEKPNMERFVLSYK